MTFNFRQLLTHGALNQILDEIASQALGRELVTNKGQPNGYAGLDSGGKVPTAQLPSSVLGGLNYQGTWNASTNTPALASGTGTKGFYYKVSVAGATAIDGISTWDAGDFIAFNGTAWDKVDGGLSEVLSVFGRIGAVAARADDYKGFEGIGVPLNLSLAASIAGGALTVALKSAAGSDPTVSDPVVLAFRNPTLTSGAANPLAVTAALSLTVPSGQAMGAANGVPFALWLVALENAGAVELALINCVTGGASPTAIFPLGNQSLISTTAIAAAPSAGVFYSTTARSSRPMRILARLSWPSGLTTAGTWDALPNIRLFGPGSKLPGDSVGSVYASTATAATANSATWVTTNLSGQITLTDAANLVRAAWAGLLDSAYGGDLALAKLYRGATPVGPPAAVFASGLTAEMTASVAASLLDAPGSTSAQTYAVKISNVTGAHNVNFPASSAYLATLLLEEIMV